MVTQDHPALPFYDIYTYLLRKDTEQTINCLTSSSVALPLIFLHSLFPVFAFFLRPIGLHCGMTYFPSIPAVAVTLDSERPPGSLIISNNKKQVSLKGNVPQDGDASVYQGKEESEAVLSALGQNSFETGRYYWEVEVNIGTEAGPETKWAVGVCLDSVTRDGWFVESPEKGFWVLAYKEGEFKVPIASESLSPRQHHQRIGVFLDQEDGDLSFYNMLDGSHIFSFIGITLHQTLRPYFSLQGAGTSVTICTTSDDTDNYPDSSPNISVTHLRSGDMGVPQEANHLLLA